MFAFNEHLASSISDVTEAPRAVELEEKLVLLGRSAVQYPQEALIIKNVFIAPFSEASFRQEPLLVGNRNC